MISTKDILSYRENSKQFDVKYSQLIKGIAVLLLFLHHVLSPSYPYTTLIIPQETLNPLVSLGKICVPIFFILSGYGMYLSYWRSKNPGISNDVEYIAKHVIKLIFSFWIIYILFVPLSLIFHYDFTEIYSRSGSFIGNMFSDFLGLAYVLQTPSVNNTWWYLGVSLVFYVISPLVFRLIKKFSRYLFFIFLLIVIVTFNFYGLRGLVIYFIPYILGAICAEKDFFNQLYHFKNNHEYLKQFFLALIFVSFVYVRQVHLIDDVKFYKIDWIFALIIIYFGYYYISTESLFGKSLISLGRESGNIFFLHSFFYAFWFKNIIYPVLKYGILIYFVFLLLCYITSRAIEFCKQKLGFQNLLKSLTTTKKWIPTFILLICLFVSSRIFYAIPCNEQNSHIITEETPIKTGNSRKVYVSFDSLITNNKITRWESTNEKIVTVSPTGVITGIAPGNAQILITVGNDILIYNVIVH